MVSFIIDTEKQSVFHIDLDPKWVQREYEAFAQDNPLRYKMFSVRLPDQRLLMDAQHGKLIVQTSSTNAYVPPERHVPKARLETLTRAFLLQEVSRGEFRLTRYGESVAAILTTPADPEQKGVPAIVVKEVLFTVGRTQPAYLRDLKKIKAAGIPAQRVGSIKSGSEYKQVSVPVEYTDRMIELGFIKSKKQY